jgi:hypothetical protein
MTIVYEFDAAAADAAATAAAATAADAAAGPKMDKRR